MKKLLSLLFALTVLFSSAGAQTTTAHPHHARKVQHQQMVYICNSGRAYAYHNSLSCHGLGRCTHEVEKVTIAKAKEMGYRPCKICY